MVVLRPSSTETTQKPMMGLSELTTQVTVVRRESGWELEDTDPEVRELVRALSESTIYVWPRHHVEVVSVLWSSISVVRW